MKKLIYLAAQERKNLIFEISLKLARKKGLFKFIIDEVAKDSQCSPSTVKHYYGGISNLRNCIIRYGRDNKIDWIMNTSVTEILC